MYICFGIILECTPHLSSSNCTHSKQGYKDSCIHTSLLHFHITQRHLLALLYCFTHFPHSTTILVVEQMFITLLPQIWKSKYWPWRADRRAQGETTLHVTWSLKFKLFSPFITNKNSKTLGGSPSINTSSSSREVW